MTDAIHLPGTVPTGDRVPALQGLLVAESGRDITVRVSEGTCTFGGATHSYQTKSLASSDDGINCDSLD
jgi:hypothetical protein